MLWKIHLLCQWEDRNTDACIFTHDTTPCHQVSRVEWPSVERFAKSQACPLPKLNLFNIGQGGSVIYSSLTVKIKLKPWPQHQLSWPEAPGPNLFVILHNHTQSYTYAVSAITLQQTEIRTEHGFIDSKSDGTDILTHWRCHIHQIWHH